MQGFEKYKLLLKRGALGLAVLCLFIFSNALADNGVPSSAFNSSSGTSSPALNKINQICSQNMMDSDTSELKIFSVGVGCFENITANLAQKSIVGLSAKLANIVFTVMILYVIFIGFKIATGVTGRIPVQKESMTGLIKLAVVAYLIYGFSDGFNFGIASSTISAIVGIDLGSQPGLVQLYLMVIGSYHSLLTIVMPQNGFGDCSSGGGLSGLSGGINVAGMGMNFGNNGTGAIWSSMDCMFSKFIGWNEKNGYGTGNGFSDKGGIALMFGYISSKILPANGFIIGGLLFSTLMTLMLGFFRLAFVYILSMIALILLFSIGPLMIPLMLFEKTRSFFDGWIRLIIGCILQPVILFAFFSFIGGLLSTTIKQLEKLFADMKPSLETSGVTRTGDTQHMDTSFVMNSLTNALDKMDKEMVINAVITLVISYLLITFIKFVGQMASELSGSPGFDLQGFAPSFVGGGGGG